ncbi:HEAT repeat domain-containing protein, partial [bacterium]|nr:HEAT repeat domain-containing protein [bacterium]
MIKFLTKYIFLSFSIISVIFCISQVYANQDIDSLIKELGNNDIYAAENAVNMLVSKGSSAVDKLLSHIDDHDRNIASRCIETLGRIGDKKAVNPLIKKLTTLAN